MPGETPELEVLVDGPAPLEEVVSAGGTSGRWWPGSGAHQSSVPSRDSVSAARIPSRMASPADSIHPRTSASFSSVRAASFSGTQQPCSVISARWRPTRSRHSAHCPPVHVRGHQNPARVRRHAGALGVALHHRRDAHPVELPLLLHLGEQRAQRAVYHFHDASPPARDGFDCDADGRGEEQEGCQGAGYFRGGAEMPEKEGSPLGSRGTSGGGRLGAGGRLADYLRFVCGFGAGGGGATRRSPEHCGRFRSALALAPTSAARWTFLRGWDRLAG